MAIVTIGNTTDIDRKTIIIPNKLLEHVYIK